MRDLNRTRRFITLIDALYEANVIVVIRAAASPQRLFVADKNAVVDEGHGDLIGDATYLHKGARDEAFAFDRTASRIIEMGSTAYLRRARNARSKRVGDVLLAVDGDVDAELYLRQRTSTGRGSLMNKSSLLYWRNCPRRRGATATSVAWSLNWPAVVWMRTATG